MSTGGSSPKRKAKSPVKSKKRALDDDNDHHDGSSYLHEFQNIHFLSYIDVQNGDSHPQKRTKQAPEVVHLTSIFIRVIFLFKCCFSS